jgi:flavin reductase (DIM6/NTAB) family NADH-FMN oxidoreductase RutF
MTRVGPAGLPEFPDDLEAVNGARFRDAMRLLPSGVVMVTVSVDGRPWGLTISSCCSLSADPPQILISLSTRTVTCQQILEGGSFGISVLGAGHGEVAALGAATGAPKFVDGYCEASDHEVASPRVRGAVYHLDCRMAAAHEHADHTVIVGAVLSAERTPAEPASEPLIYFDRTYRRVGADLSTVSA